MSRREVTDEIRREIAALRRSGMSEKLIAAQVGVSRSSVHNVLCGRPGRKGKESESATLECPHVDSLEDSATGSDPAPITDEQIQAKLRQDFESYNALARAARLRGDAHAAQAWQRLSNAASHELRQHKVEPTDPDDAYGVQGRLIREAASRGRSRLAELLGRVVEGWPVCPVCHRPYKPEGGAE